MNENKQLCPNCKTGADALKLDRCEPMCPYMEYHNAPVRLWQYNSRFDGAIIETLENSFGELKSKDTITEAVISAAQNATCDSKADYLQELKYEKQNSFLEDLDELNIEVEFQRTAETSIAYMVLHQLGLNPDEIFEREDFPHIMDFNTTSVISVLGDAVSSISEEALRGISETIRAEVREEIKNRKNFAENKNAVYNESKEENTPTINDERTGNYLKNPTGIYV